LDFYESVDHFHHEWDIDHVSACKNIANKIFQLYCGVNAPLAVNLPSKIRLKTEDSILQGDIKRDTFDSAANEIYQVMNRDSFARFKISGLWSSYVAHPDRHPDGVPPPAKKRLADCYTGRRNSDSLMQFIGQQTIDEVRGSKGNERSELPSTVLYDEQANEANRKWYWGKACHIHFPSNMQPASLATARCLLLFYTIN